VAVFLARLAEIGSEAANYKMALPCRIAGYNPYKLGMADVRWV
jgi:hypothetical protein